MARLKKQQVEESVNIENKEIIECKSYNIILTVLCGNETKQTTLNVYFNDEEANRANKYFAKKIVELEKTNSSVAISLIYRNANNELFTYGICNVIAINHNISMFEDVIE